MTEVERVSVRAKRRAVDDFLRMATTAKNIAMRSNWRADSAWLDGELAKTGSLPKRPAWSGALYSYPTIRAAVPELLSSVAAAIQKAVDRKWVQDRYDVLIRQEKSCPHFRMGQPAPVPTQAVRLSHVIGDNYSIVFSPYSTDAGINVVRRLTLDIVARDAFQRTQLEAIVAGAVRMGQVTIERDRNRPTRFYVRISYTRLVARRTTGLAAAINRGLRSFVAAVIDGGETWVYDGEDIEAYLKQMQRRRRAYQYSSKASARWGHGRKRTIRPIEHLAGKAERWRDTRNQTIARRLARWLAERGVAVVYIEDFTGIRGGEPERLDGGKIIWDRIQEWPYYDLGMRLASCLEEEGITVLVVPPQYISRTCPKCGASRAEHCDRRHWQLRCTTPRCGFRRHLDVAAALNVLARGETMRKTGSSGDGRLREAHESKRSAARKAARKGAKGDSQ